MALRHMDEIMSLLHREEILGHLSKWAEVFLTEEKVHQTEEKWDLQTDSRLDHQEKRVWNLLVLETMDRLTDLTRVIRMVKDQTEWLCKMIGEILNFMVEEMGHQERGDLDPQTG